MPDALIESAAIETIGGGSPGVDAASPPFAEVLRFSRSRAGLTQKALADLSTISPRAIRDLESGRANARTQTLFLLADGLRLNGLMRELFVQAGLGGRPAGTSIETALPVPTPVNAILGRDGEVCAMMDVLESGRRRMISLSGLPGVGKTRVAMELAAQLGARRGWPVLWVGLAARGLNVRGKAVGPLIRSLRLLMESGADDLSTVAKLVGQHEALLVLDAVADVKVPLGAEELLAYCPGLRMISTSRAPWQVSHVQPSVLAPLPVPGPEWDASEHGIQNLPSVRLLVDRLTELRPGFALAPADVPAVAQLCRRLDGLPVALEAVAALFQVFGLRELAEVPAEVLLQVRVPARSTRRQETLGSLLGSRLDGLSNGQRAVLGQLARPDRRWTVQELAQEQARPLGDVVGDLSVLIGNGLVLAPQGEPTTDLRIPNLLRALVSSRESR